MTPRKLQALLRVHYDVMKQQNGITENTQKQTGFIDSIPGW